MDETATSNGEVDVAISPAVSTSSNVVARVTKGHVSWWELPAPRLQASDSEEHISSVISTNFGLGVDMSVYLSPARMVIDGLTSEERDNYKAKGIRGLKIPAAWKRWKSMHRQQHAKFINVLYSLAPCHAQKVAEAIAADVLTSTTMVDEEVSKNRTMHEIARAMHVITDTDNISALSKALGRYNRLELDRAHSKLDEAIEVNICSNFFSCQFHRLHISFFSSLHSLCCTPGIYFWLETVDNYLQRPTGLIYCHIYSLFSYNSKPTMHLGSLFACL